FTNPPGHRAQLLAALDMVVREAVLRHEEKASGQVSMFDMGGPAMDDGPRPDPVLPELPRWSESERLAREKEILGFFISGHPLERFRDEVRVFEQVNTTTLKQFRDQKIELACVVTSLARQISKRNGAEWGRIMIEDFHGTATVLAFGDVWDQYHDILTQDAAVLIRGSVSGRDRDEDAPPIFLDSVAKLETLRHTGSLALELRLESDSMEQALSEATVVLRSHPGPAPLFVSVSETRNGITRDGVRLKSRSITVAPNDALLAELRELFGAERIRLVRS
ncbi:MAG: hypothetical protein ABIV28_03190, partial [Longimicrobiales bacterium]